jgi:hypothetical protein
MTEQQLGYVPHEDMPLYLYMGPMSQQNYDALFEYQKTAGSFASALIGAFWNADGNNRIKLLDAFPWLFVLREDMITDAELWWEQYEEENKVCSTCNGNGSYLSGHYADPDSYEVTCPDCDTHDPDTRDR